jgi:hypothetical protein
VPKNHPKQLEVLNVEYLGAKKSSNIIRWASINEYREDFVLFSRPNDVVSWTTTVVLLTTRTTMNDVVLSTTRTDDDIVVVSLTTRTTTNDVVSSTTRMNDVVSSTTSN